VGTQVIIAASQVDKGRLGYQAISFDSMVATTAITIKAGSKVEIAGALYEFTADEVESGGTFAAIGNSSAAYIYIVPAGATSTFIYSTTAPTWDVAKQGWYNGTSRAIGGLYKDAAGTGYVGKYIFHAVGAVGQTLDITTGAGNVTENLPPAAVLLGAGEIDIFKADSGAGKVVVTANGGDLINGFATWEITDQYGHVRLKAISGGWRAIACDGTWYITESTANDSQPTPADGTWYNPGSRSLTLPAGVYELLFDATVYANAVINAGSAYGITAEATLSLANNTQSDAGFTVHIEKDGKTGGTAGSDNEAVAATMHKMKKVYLGASTQYFLNAKATGCSGFLGGTLNLRGDLGTTRILAKRVG
jgi:hypothetical protein